MEVTNTSEKRQYDATALVNGLGGALSLYLGVSLIMIFELMELFIRIIAVKVNNMF